VFERWAEPYLLSLWRKEMWLDDDVKSGRRMGLHQSADGIRMRALFWGGLKFTTVERICALEN
jgi:hypothetical protein